MFKIKIYFEFKEKGSDFYVGKFFVFYAFLQVL